MFLTDTHCHLNAPEFKGRVDEFLTRAKNVLVERFFVVGWDKTSSEDAILLSQKIPEVYAVVGLHPVEVASLQSWNEATFKKLAVQSKVVAIGEIGLDYYWKKTDEEHKLQRDVFISQINLANLLKLPIVVHCRDAYEDVLDILKKHPPQKGGIMHCYNGPLSLVKPFIEIGMFISIGGPLTFKNAENLRQMIKTMDLNHLLIETDSPYLAPMPYRGKPNEPSYLRLIFDKIVELTGEKPDRLAQTLEANLLRKFHVKHE